MLKFIIFLRGRLYYSLTDDDMKHNEILVSNMDGSNTSTVFASDLDSNAGAFQGLRLNLSSNYLYFYNNEEIGYIDLRINQKVSVYKTAEEQSVGAITVYEDNIFFVDNSNNSIRRCKISDCNSSEIVRNATGKNHLIIL